MTTTAKATRRETLSSIRECGKSRAIIVELQSTFCSVRLKGCSRRHTVSYGQIFLLAAKNTAEASRREKLEARKAKQK